MEKINLRLGNKIIGKAKFYTKGPELRRIPTYLNERIVRLNSEPVIYGPEGLFARQIVLPVNESFGSF